MPLAILIMATHTHTHTQMFMTMTSTCTNTSVSTPPFPIFCVKTSHLIFFLASSDDDWQHHTHISIHIHTRSDCKERERELCVCVCLMPSTAIDHALKLLVIGDSGVGKTSLLRRFTHADEDDEQPSALGDTEPTVGVDLQQRLVTVMDKRCRLTIWDTGTSMTHSECVVCEKRKRRRASSRRNARARERECL